MMYLALTNNYASMIGWPMSLVSQLPRTHWLSRPCNWCLYTLCTVKPTQLPTAGWAP